MQKTELDKMDIIVDGVVFHPYYSSLPSVPIFNEKGEVFDYDYPNFVLIKTAEEMYQKYLNPLPPQPTTEDFNLEIDYRVTLLEIMKGA